MYRVQTAAYSRYITAFTINGTYETKPIREKPNETQIERNNFFFSFFTFFYRGLFFVSFKISTKTEGNFVQIEIWGGGQGNHTQKKETYLENNYRW